MDGPAGSPRVIDLGETARLLALPEDFVLRLVFCVIVGIELNQPRRQACISVLAALFRWVKRGDDGGECE